ncbi:FHA domain-containing protein [bacterium]|nr:FHA domain-containing protein [candidate division CSSED10-310 bacterium]
MDKKAKKNVIESLNEDPTFVEFSKIQQEYELYRNRIQKLEEHKERFSEAVLLKVRADYSANITDLQDKMMPLLGKLDDKLQRMISQRTEMHNSLQGLQQELEELELRFLVGEYTEDVYEPKKEGLTSGMGQIKEQHENLNSQIEMLDGILAEHREAAAIRKPPEEEKAVGPVENPDPFEELSEEFDVEEKAASDESVAAVAVAAEGPETQAEDALIDYEDYIDTSMVDDIDQGDEEDGQGEEYDRIGEILDGEEGDAEASGIPVLEIIEGEYKGGSYPVSTNLMKIGRGPDNDIYLSLDTSVSRHHAQLVYQGGKYSVIDLNSSNGTFVNGVPVKEKALKHGDIVVIGQTKIEFQLPGEK